MSQKLILNIENVQFTVTEYQHRVTLPIKL